MGQGPSSGGPPPTLEQLNRTLAQRFAQKSYTPLELYCFNDVFRSLADTQSGVKYWSESTLCRFLELPDALGVGPVIFHMASFLGAFPFPSQAPAILTYDALLKVVTILTERYGSVLKKRNRELWLRELYRSLSVYDKGVRSSVEDKEKELDGKKKMPTTGNQQGFAVDAPEDGDDEEEDDELVLAALDSMDAIEVFKHGEHSDVHHSIIPTDNLLKLVELLLLIAPMDAQESLSSFAGKITDERVEDLRRTANIILSSFGVENNPGVDYRTFTTVVSTCLPYLFDGLNPLFEHFLFAKNLDLSKRKPTTDTTPSEPPHPTPIADPEPILSDPSEILTHTTLTHLSFFIKGSNLFRRLRPLYSGNTHGFSMRAFEKQVFNWRAPTILLVSGRLLPSTPSSTRERALADSLPPQRHPSSIPTNSPQSATLTYGAYIPSQWKTTPKTPFGDTDTKLFQLSPTHDVFPASAYSKDYIAFTRSSSSSSSSSSFSGINFGSPIPPSSSSSSHTTSTPLKRLGPISLSLDDSLEFAIFTHISSSSPTGGSFTPSSLPSRRSASFQDRFEIDELEVWGCGGDDVAAAQRREWAFEAREAEARRRINLGTGDVEADRELLKMAGLIGGGRSGGSV
ncbi:unnamed protein product [Periconia digitata]|uniref:Restriction of telomere capping protein 5 n=1 Tax=Periconia digitata TaxID=1303443 RepID=A0A9W4XLY5_9PLEO|nr:unnamed protein product [Periconia digitata]